MPEPLLDQPQRDRIRADLDTNLMVLAGAGAGKTHALIERMVGCVRTGRAEVERLAAITFTRKAAGEMRGRFFAKLRAEAETAEGVEAANLRRALEKIDQCFIGTIHSFCGRLLRERPVEAGLAPDFSEIDDREEGVLRRAAWDRFVQRCFADADERLDELEALGVVPEDLFAFFEQRCLYADVPLKPTAAPRPDLRPAVDQLLAFLDDVERRVPDPLPDRRDRFMEAMVRARHYCAHHGLHGPAHDAALLGMMAGRLDVTLKCWKPNDGFAKELRDVRIGELQDGVIHPALAAWRRHVYTHAAAFVDEAVRAYDAERHRGGTLTFQDLLLGAARLLRDHAPVRRYFQRRYRCLFVDEFQDTDPVQAEVLAYLTGTDPEEPDWRRLRPRPGSLFLVGDEKQSIYRFRRADIDTFRLVRDGIAETGGGVLSLNTSFRSLGRLCDWINGAFPALFDAHARAHQADFGELFKVHPPGDDPHGVRRLTTERVARHSRDEVAAQEADRVAAFIAAALAGRTEFNGAGEEAVLRPVASPGDFMILTRTTKCLAVFARALEERGVPYDVVGGGRLGDAAEVRAVVELLEAVHAPDNPLPLLAYLRGPLVGLGDDELFAFRRASGVFSFKEPVPEGLPEETRERIQTAFDRLNTAEALLKQKTAPAALEMILEAFGLIPFASARSGGSTRAGTLLRLLALVREWSAAGRHWGEVVEELRALVDDRAYKAEEMTLESGREDVVRLMNLHQAKGLQARVVFLADAADTSAAGRAPECHVSRGTGPEGGSYVSMPVRRPKGSWGWEVIGEPEGWDADAEEEGRFAAAEEVRLLYVAATRAERLLVVGRYAGKDDAGPWSPLYAALEQVPELPACVPPAPAADDEPLPDLARLAEERRARREAAARPTYRVRSVTGERPDLDLAAPAPARSGHGRAYGVLVHRLFEAAVQGRLPDDEKAYLGALAGEAGLPDRLADEARSALDAFRASPLWRELRTADAVYTEVPFAAPHAGDGLPGVLRGVIDLVYRVDGAWKIVDYKTGVADDALPEVYAEQVRAYAAWWERATGEAVAGKSVVAVDPFRFFPVAS